MSDARVAQAIDGVGLRSHADGCDTRHSVGFIEKWYADEALGVEVVHRCAQFRKAPR